MTPRTLTQGWPVPPPVGGSRIVIRCNPLRPLTGRGEIDSPPDSSWQHTEPGLVGVLSYVGSKVATELVGEVSSEVFEARMACCTGLTVEGRLLPMCPAARDFKGSIYCADCRCGTGEDAKIKNKMRMRGVKCPRGRF